MKPWLLISKFHFLVSVYVPTVESVCSSGVRVCVVAVHFLVAQDWLTWERRGCTLCSDNVLQLCVAYTETLNRTLTAAICIQVPGTNLEPDLIPRFVGTRLAHSLASYPGL